MSPGAWRGFRQWHVYRVNLTPPGSPAAVSPLVLVLSSSPSNRLHGGAVVTEVVRRPPGSLQETAVPVGPGEIGEEFEGAVDPAMLMTLPEGTLVEQTGRLTTDSVARLRTALTLVFEADAWRATL